VKKLRRVLGDTVENPQFIETLPKFGYRFIAPVEWVGDSGYSHELRSVVPIAQPGSAPDSQSVTGKSEETSANETSPIAFINPCDVRSEADTPVVADTGCSQMRDRSVQEIYALDLRFH
jgi:hypothetical protein